MLKVKGSFQYKIGNKDTAILTAAQNLLSKSQAAIGDIAAQILESHIRALFGVNTGHQPDIGTQ